VSVREEIENTCYRYARGFDEEDLDALTDCFTEDAEFFSGELITGREEIRAFLTERRRMRAEAGERVRHVTSNIAIEQHGDDEARVHSYFTLVVTTPAGSGVGVVGTYTDRWVRQAGRWLIASRHIARDQPE